MIDAIIKCKKILLGILERLVCLLLVGLVFVVLWGIFTALMLKVEFFRSFISAKSNQWVQDVASIMFIWLSTLGTAVAFSTQAHLGVDVLVRAFDDATAKLTRIIVHMLVIIFSAAIFVYGGILLVCKTLAWQSVYPVIGIPKGYVYMAVPIAGIFIIMFAVEAIIEEKLSEKGQVI
ncbi:MAG: TRAP transporter small permease subunit [Phycisphaerae bacterium]|nr:TRAP transporter small permease subunit [Phycisphaerae bacterium]